MNEKNSHGLEPLLAVLVALVSNPVACSFSATASDAGDREATSRDLENAVFRDQYGNEWSGGELRKGPAVLILGMPDTAEINTRWDKEVVRPTTAGARIAVYRAVDLRGYPRFAAGLIAERIRSGTDPPGTPVLLDWKGTLASCFGAAADRTTVLLLDAGGTERFRSTAEPDPEAAARFREALRLALAEAAHSGQGSALENEPSEVEVET